MEEGLEHSGEEGGRGLRQVEEQEHRQTWGEEAGEQL